METTIKQFTDDQQYIVDLILSLNSKEIFKVKQIREDEFEIIYNGGYNGVYDYTVNLKILGMRKAFHGKIFYWEFELTSQLYNDIIEVDHWEGALGFMDFFIDSFIRDVGVFMQMREYYC